MLGPFELLSLFLGRWLTPTFCTLLSRLAYDKHSNHSHCHRNGLNVLRRASEWAGIETGGGTAAGNPLFEL